LKYSRELTAVIGGPIIIWIIGWAPPYLYDAAIALVCGLALYEFLDLGRKKGYPLSMPLCIALMAFILAAFVLEPISVEMGVFLTLLVIPGYYVFASSDLEQALPGSAVSVLATLYVGMLGGSLIRMRNDFPEGAKLIFFLTLVVWLGDAGAYYFGRTFGRHKLSPRISPKKTVEGAIGGVFASVVTALVLHFTIFPTFPILHTVIAAVLLSVTGIIGDLAESMWKRSAAVKDSGTLLPGHGGFLDRLDSILFTAPILYVYWFLIVHHFQSFKIMSA
jgi:CDP-diglyceride synthetase